MNDINISSNEFPFVNAPDTFYITTKERLYLYSIDNLRPLQMLDDPIITSVYLYDNKSVYVPVDSYILDIIHLAIGLSELLSVPFIGYENNIIRIRTDHNLLENPYTIFMYNMYICLVSSDISSIIFLSSEIDVCTHITMPNCVDYISFLPTEILHYIITLIPPYVDRCNVSFVNKQIRGIYMRLYYLEHSVASFSLKEIRSNFQCIVVSKTVSTDTLTENLIRHVFNVAKNYRILVLLKTDELRNVLYHRLKEVGIKKLHLPGVTKYKKTRNVILGLHSYSSNTARNAYSPVNVIVYIDRDRSVPDGYRKNFPGARYYIIVGNSIDNIIDVYKDKGKSRSLIDGIYVRHKNKKPIYNKITSI
eukprot:TRINITY_DN11004_c0_g1_i1.p1 TRINITY_DN11004_c0_g1~~TRINITY_DN11004_c0_g1_i1.p1  ORF type:complete len:363 (-),score=22.40 TRINITY_DN11004_c0_g1_i1:269-1357(-)